MSLADASAKAEVAVEAFMRIMALHTVAGLQQVKNPNGVEWTQESVVLSSAAWFVGRGMS